MLKIEIIPYSKHWSAEFLEVAEPIRHALGDLALRIDHIGSTSVRGLSAKDVIDVQITASAIEPAEPFVEALTELGYLWLDHIQGDHIPAGMSSPLERWKKLIFRSGASLRRANVHVRIAGNPNQRYALLFRDYMRAHPAAAGGYAELKRQLARYHPDDEDAYYDMKDPVCDIIMAGAEDWAAATDWQAGASDA